MSSLLHAPDNQAGTRLPAPLPCPSAAEKRRQDGVAARPDVFLLSQNLPASVAPSLFALRSSTPLPDRQLAPKSLTLKLLQRFHLNSEPIHQESPITPFARRRAADVRRCALPLDRSRESRRPADGGTLHFGDTRRRLCGQEHGKLCCDGPRCRNRRFDVREIRNGSTRLGCAQYPGGTAKGRC